MLEPVWRIAVPCPLPQLFDYLPPRGSDPGKPPEPGTRVRVPFGRRRLTAILIEVAGDSDMPRRELRRATAVPDPEPVLPAAALELCRWAAGYYHHPIGAVVSTALPTAARRDGPLRPRLTCWRLTEAGRTALLEGGLGRAPRQKELAILLAGHGEGLGDTHLTESMPRWREPARSLLKRGFVSRELVTTSAPAGGPALGAVPAARPELSAEQAMALSGIERALGGFHSILLEGVTGSGKTEVYLRAVQRVVAQGGQALILVPEIALTPQLEVRFRERLGSQARVLHSGLGEKERLAVWLSAMDGRLPILIGTRSAVFTPMPKLGLIVVDEEHDPSLKQQDGFRYSARDVAVKRAAMAGIPIVLGSATPSLESLANAAAGRFEHSCLPRRMGSAGAPRVRLLDLRGQQLEDGLSEGLSRAMEQHLDDAGQIMLFLNRRGYAPLLLCHDCGWLADCQRCDARMTLHRSILLCHHCGARRPPPPSCPGCGSQDLRPVGVGTQRLEQAVRKRFPGTETARLDRDAVRRRGRLQQTLTGIASGQYRIVLGTQMLAKGHHFPGITLVGVVDADQGLFGVDYRSAERMAQLIVQVAGRAGRAERPGEVLIQTHYPDHPLFGTLLSGGYPAFAEMALRERAEAGLPPFGHQALLRAESPLETAGMGFLAAAAEQAPPEDDVLLLGPVPSPMERRAGRYRAQLVVQAAQRPPLHRFLNRWLPGLGVLKEARGVRWSVDVDPQEMV